MIYLKVSYSLGINLDRARYLAPAAGALLLGCLPPNPQMYEVPDYAVSGGSVVPVDETERMELAESLMLDLEDGASLGQDLTDQKIDSKLVLEISVGEDAQPVPFEIYYSSGEEHLVPDPEIYRIQLGSISTFLQEHHSGSLVLNVRPVKMFLAPEWAVVDRSKTFYTEGASYSFVNETNQTIFLDKSGVESCQSIVNFRSGGTREEVRERFLYQEDFCNSVGALIYAAREGAPEDSEMGKSYRAFLESLQSLSDSGIIGVPDPFERDQVVPVNFIRFSGRDYFSVLNHMKEYPYQRPGRKVEPKVVSEDLSRRFAIKFFSSLSLDGREERRVRTYIAEADFPFLSADIERSLRQLITAGFDYLDNWIAY